MSLSLSCLDSGNVRTIIFDCKRLSITKGTKTEGFIDLSEFFVPIENYSFGEIVVPANTIINLDFGNLSTDTLKVVGLFPDYSSIELADEQYLLWAWASESPSYTFRSLGKIMILSGNDVVGVDEMVIQNVTDVDIITKILLTK